MKDFSAKELTEKINYLENFIEKYKDKSYMFGSIEFFIKKVDELKVARAEKIGKSK